MDEQSRRLKCDFHMHSGEDQLDFINYSARDLIEKAAALKFDVLAFTFHGQVFDDPGVTEFARDRGILLIPGCEVYVGRKEVLCLNITQAEVDGIHTFEDLRAWKRTRGEAGLIIAPHPFYPLPQCLWAEFERNADLWDAVEYCHMHTRWLNFNRRAVQAADKHRLALLGTSDAHALFMFGAPYTLVDAEKNLLSVFRAIRARKVEYVSQPQSLWNITRTFCCMEFRHRVLRIFSDRHRQRWLNRKRLKQRQREREQARRS